MLTGLHFLLTYMCNSECDHCFLYCSPRSKGTFAVNRIREILDEGIKIKTVTTIYFEGGEAFLFYPIMLEGIRLAREREFRVGVVTNGYFATDEEDVRIWLQPLKELGISDLSISNDLFHYAGNTLNPAVLARKVAEDMGLPVAHISIEEPSVAEMQEDSDHKGEPVIGGTTMLRGRAVEKLADSLPRKSLRSLTTCPHEDLEHPQRVHIDPYGNVHICQGLSMGNVFETPLPKLDKEYNAESHPVCGPLVRGGPALLAKECDVKHDEGYADECHACYCIRRELQDTFPGYLTPPQVYGQE